MVLKIKANELRNFVKKTTASGLIEDCKLDFKEDGLHMCHKDQQGVILIGGVLAKTAFNTYEVMEIPIKSSKTLITVLGTFKDNLINIVKEDNMVKIMDENGGIDLSLAEEVSCYKDGLPDLKYDNTVAVKKSMVDTIMQRNSIINTDELKVVLENKKILFKIGKEVDKAEVSEITTCENNLSADFDLPYFQKLTSEMDQIVDLSLSPEAGHPSMFEEKSVNYTINYYLTSISESE